MQDDKVITQTTSGLDAEIMAIKEIWEILNRFDARTAARMVGYVTTRRHDEALAVEKEAARAKVS